MTVKELVIELSKYNPEAEVCFDADGDTFSLEKEHIDVFCDCHVAIVITHIIEDLGLREKE